MSIQLQFNIDDLSDDTDRLAMIQQQIDELAAVASNTRRRLFAEIDALKKKCAILEHDNAVLCKNLAKKEDTSWLYRQKDFLFCLTQTKH